MAPQQRPGRSKQDYSTPDNFIVAVKAKLGIDEFSIDLAADSSNTKAAVWYDEAADSLQMEWQHIKGWAWLNPPFNKIGPWAEKAWWSGANIAMLVPASVGSNWWRDFVHEKARVLLLNGRLAFIPDKPKWLYPKDCALLLYNDQVKVGYEVWSWR